MDKNQDRIKILCYGDSNTWGDPPGSEGRYPYNIRWTGRLQNLLVNKYQIIEEGLCGRTTIMDDPKEEGRNGKTYLISYLKTHKQIDLVILMLGSNDLKERFNLTAKEISENIEELIKIIKPIKVLLLSPPIVNLNCKNPPQGMKGAEEKSKQLAKYYKEVAIRQGCEFIDIAQYVQPSNVDGCHLEKDTHTRIAEILEKEIKIIFLYLTQRT